MIENIMFVIIIFKRCVICFFKGYCFSCFWVKNWSIGRKESRRKNKNVCLFIVMVFLDFVILDLGNVNFVNNIDFGKE